MELPVSVESLIIEIWKKGKMIPLVGAMTPRLKTCFQ